MSKSTKTDTETTYLEFLEIQNETDRTTTTLIIGNTDPDQLRGKETALDVSRKLSMDETTVVEVQGKVDKQTIKNADVLLFTAPHDIDVNTLNYIRIANNYKRIFGTHIVIFADEPKKSLLHISDVKITVDSHGDPEIVSRLEYDHVCHEFIEIKMDGID